MIGSDPAEYYRPSREKRHSPASEEQNGGALKERHSADSPSIGQRRADRSTQERHSANPLPKKRHNTASSYQERCRRVAKEGGEAHYPARKPDRWVKPFFRQNRTILAFALFMGLLTFVFSAALMFTSGYLIGRAAEMPGNIFMLHLPLIFVRVFGIGKPILQYFERLTSHDWVLRMTSKLRLNLYGILEEDAVFFKRKHRTGDVLGLLAEDIGHLQNLYLRTIFPTVVAWLVYAALVVALGFFSLWFALAMALVTGVLVFFVPLVSIVANRARIARRKAMKNDLYRELTDNVLGVSDWVLAQRGHEYLVHYKATETAMREIEVDIDRFSRRRDLVFQILFGIAAVLLLLWSGSYFGGNPGGSANWIAAFMLGFFPLIDAFAPLSEAATESVVHRDSITRLNELPDHDDNEREESPTPAGPLAIEVDGVDFAYPGTTRNTLEGLSLTVKAGEKLAILGRSGSGKSTLASLIRGDLEPSQGSVSINGAPTKRFGDDIARYIGVIQQDTYLFNASLIDNLRIGNPAATEEEVWAVLDDVGLKEMALRLPDGLETLVDEAGKRFSGGERHRIALARVLLQDVPIIILDEPTVGLDPLTEQALLETFRENTEGKTLIMITHHLQGVSAMDRVVFIENGAVAISGSPAELAQSNEHYRRLLEFDRGIELEA